MRTVQITVPEIPPSLNQILRMHYHERDRENKRWTELVAVYQPIPAIDDRDRWGKPIKRAHVTITYYFADARRRDSDNYSGKFLLDGLVNTGVIEDDSFNHVKLLLVGKVDRDNPRTEILVEEAQV